ncbi:MAG TPA: LysM peptidoglycan-binding domain-containing protein [Candidatus Rifleibacterium sp.]|jgi:LysM repeat protein|nr:LysM peptidoglycan-binding domain-containing protein [Candidatus Rifleibacterium sp.]
MKKSSAILTIALVGLMASAVAAATTHTIREGDTLWELAAKHYGDPTLYPILLEVNNIDNPRTILNGTVIVIPDKDDMKAIANENDPDKKKALIARAGGGGGGKNPGSKDDKKPTSPDAVSRGGEEVDPNDTSFSNILKGPKVAPDKLIKTNVP